MVPIDVPIHNYIFGPPKLQPSKSCRTISPDRTRFLSSTLLPFLVPLLKMNIRRKGDPYCKGVTQEPSVETSRKICCQGTGFEFLGFCTGLGFGFRGLGFRDLGFRGWFAVLCLVYRV